MDKWIVLFVGLNNRMSKLISVSTSSLMSRIDVSNLEKNT